VALEVECPSHGGEDAIGVESLRPWSAPDIRWEIFEPSSGPGGGRREGERFLGLVIGDGDAG